MSEVVTITSWPDSLKISEITKITEIEKLTKLEEWPEQPLNTQTTICGWAPPKVTDAGDTALHAVLSVVAFAVAIWSAYEQMRIFNMRYELADAYASLAEQQWTRFDGRYRPVEAMLVAECMAENPIEPDYESARSRGAEFASFGSAQANIEYERNLKLYNLCPGTDRLQANAVNDALLSDDSVNYALRDEEYNALVEDDMRFNRRASLLNLGRDLLSTSMRYGQAANSILAGAAAAQAQTTAGAMAFLGYIRNREETQYPQFLIQSTSPGAILGGASTGAGLMSTAM
jgi:hypothetical protein